MNKDYLWVNNDNCYDNASACKKHQHIWGEEEEIQFLESFARGDIMEETILRICSRCFDNLNFVHVHLYLQF